MKSILFRRLQASTWLHSPHQQVEPVPIDTDADLVAISFFSGFAEQAYHLADMYRDKGKTVIAGGPHATFWPDETLEHCDAVVTGEAESV